MATRLTANDRWRGAHAIALERVLRHIIPDSADPLAALWRVLHGKACGSCAVCCRPTPVKNRNGARAKYCDDSARSCRQKSARMRIAYARWKSTQSRADIAEHLRRYDRYLVAQNVALGIGAPVGRPRRASWR